MAAMGWHCITVWECELKPSRREETLEALAYTLNKIWMEDHHVVVPYSQDEEVSDLSLAAENVSF